MEAKVEELIEETEEEAYEVVTAEEAILPEEPRPDQVWKPPGQKGLGPRPNGPQKETVVSSMLEHQVSMLSLGQNVSIIYCDGQMTLDPSILSSGSHAIYVSPQGHLNLPSAPKGHGHNRRLLLPSSEPAPVPALPLESETKTDYQCGECPEYFTTQDLLSAHQNRVHAACSVCQGKFPSLETHIESHPHCSWCFRKFESHYRLDIHLLETHPKCSWCEDQFLGDREYSRHISAAHPSCRKCSARFLDNDALKKHAKKSHPRCSICSFEASGLSKMEEHMKTHPECLWCRKGRYRSVEEYNHHCRMAHPWCNICLIHHQSHEEWLERHAKCFSCNARFNTVEETEAHKAYAHPMCIKCPGMGIFASRADFALHMRAVHPKCDRCHRQCSSQESYRAHISHAHPSCGYCHETFDSRSLLRKHRVAHHPHCTLCPLNDVFISAEALNEHTMEFHSPCTVCHVFFANAEDLSVHMKNDHPVCSVCGRRFDSRPELRSHRHRRHPEHYSERWE